MEDLRMVGFFKGTATAMVTPFKDGEVNFEAFGKMIEYQIENGTDMLLVLETRPDRRCC